MDLNSFKTDPKLEEEGKVVSLSKTSSIRVARLGNKKYKDVFKELSAPYATAIRNKTLDDSIAENILAETLARSVLLGWEGLKLNGVDIEYSVDKAMEILLDPEYKDFRDLVVNIASDMEVYKAAADEDLKGN